MTEDQFPRDFVKRLQAQLGDQWMDFVSAHREPSPISIRLNPGKTDITQSGDPVLWSKFGRYLKERPSFTLDPEFHAGKYYVQEASSMFLEQAFLQAVDQSNALNVLDLCAAPGGKSTHLLSLMNRESLLVSNETIQSRASILSENIQKWGHTNVVVTNNDPRDFQRLPRFFDVIVIDAPCSGEGLFRKDPVALKEWSEEHVMLCSKRQRRILNDVWPALKPGGILIYSTCTYHEAENEENLKWLHEDHDFESARLQVKNEWGVREIEIKGLTGYRFYPHQVKGEGFFIAVLKKTGDKSTARINSKNSFSQPHKKKLDQLSEWIINPDEKYFIERNDLMQFFQKNKVEEIGHIVKNLHVISAGTFIAKAKHDKLIPEHSFALSLEINRDRFDSVRLDVDQALKFLRKETISVQADKKGFALVTFQNIPLGWINILDNRVNNLYPSEWRIRIR
jgi:NOL1/NOP2/sun family putative RNA methylase